MFKKIVLISVLLWTPKAFCFVQMAVKGYPTCVACHVSPNGGGLLTDYGRGVSNAYMSTWSMGDAFAQPMFGLVKNSETVKYGGDLRAIQADVKNSTIDRGEFFLMQQNVELGVTIDNVTFVGTAGTLEAPDGTPKKGQFLSERHYAIWSPTMQSRLRIGKFRQTFGLFTDNHVRLIKNPFGFGSLSETYNMEYTQIDTDHELIFNTSLGRLENPQSTNSERNFSGHYVHYLDGHSRIGGSLLMGESSTKRRFLSGVNAVFPVSKSWIGIFELDYERSHLTSLPQNGIDAFASFAKLGHNTFSGFMWYLLFEHYSRDDGTSYSLTHQPGLGVQWLPVSHFNIQIEYVRQINNLNPGEPTHQTFFLFHYYL